MQPSELQRSSLDMLMRRKTIARSALQPPKHLISRALLVAVSLFAVGDSSKSAHAFQLLEEPISHEELLKSLDSKDPQKVREALLMLSPDDRLPWIDKISDVNVSLSSNSSPTAPKIADSDFENDQNLFVNDPSPQNHGGGAIPNFAEIIQLIERTIDGNWASDGGTSNIVPYQNGIRVDASGTLARISPTEIQSLEELRKNRPALDWSKLGDWQIPSELRWISLDVLNDVIQKSGESGSSLKLEETLLGGICRIDYLAWDEDQKTWLIGGPAGDLVMNEKGELVHRTLRLPPVLLEDVVTVGSTVFHGVPTLGCSIDPDETRLRKAYEFAQQPNTVQFLRTQPKKWATNWRDKLGQQSTRVFGIPPQTTTALALLVADVEMKRMALEFDPLPASVRSYWKEIDLLNRTPQSPIIRWWYTMGTTKILFDKERNLYRIPHQNVQVQSESQFVNEQGTRVATAMPDIAADVFAKNFSQNHELIQRESTAQGRLRHIFDLAIVFEIIRLREDLTQQTNLKNLLPNPIPTSLANQPQSIESIATTHVMPTGTTVAIASGGVLINLTRTESRLGFGRRELAKVKLPASPPKEKFDEERSSKQIQLWRDIVVGEEVVGEEKDAVKQNADEKEFSEP